MGPIWNNKTACLVLIFLCHAGMASALEAGSAKMEITGPIGAPLNGYGDRMGRSSVSVHDPLWARALYLDDGTTKLFLVGTDLCLINPELRERVLALAPAEVPKENIILTATHTHSGQGGMIKQHPFRFVSGRFVPEVLESTARGIAQSMHEAYNRRRRAAIGFGTAQQNDLSVNRRYRGGPIDEQIGVILVEDADGNAISVVTNFAAHPTSVPDSDHYAYSADYPGFYYDEIEKNAAEGCVALFLNGAEGNQTITAPKGTDGWARTEAVGRLLAERVHEVANKLTCGEATLHVASARPALPPALGSAFAPSQTFLQTLEINDLLMTFVPGEACVEIALELRKRALERGYQAQFTIGLSNDYVMYFVSREHYADLTYESVCTNYGPGIEDWFYREFGKLMQKGEAAPVPLTPPAGTRDIPGALVLRLEGDPYALGYQRGQHFAPEITALYQSRVFQPLDARTLLPDSGGWSYWPKFMNPTPLALPVLGMASHKWLGGISMPLMREIEGMADGAQLPFDAVWLMQNAGHLAATQDKQILFQAPLCTVFAATGDRAGADQLLVGRNLDSSTSDPPVVTEVFPTEGQAFVQVGFAWNQGVFTGMNAAGLVVALERNPLEPVPVRAALPLEFLLRSVLQDCQRVSEAIPPIEASADLEGYHVMLAGFTEKGEPEAVVISRDAAAAIRNADKGLLLGTLPSDPSADPDTVKRYVRVLERLEEERIIGREEVERVLTDAETTNGGSDAVWSPATRHSVVFMPKERTLYAAFPKEDGRPGPYTAISLKGTPGHE